MSHQLIIFTRKIHSIRWGKILCIYLELSTSELNFKEILKRCLSWFVLCYRKSKLSGNMTKKKWNLNAEPKLMMKNWLMMISLLRTLFVNSFWSFIFTLTNRWNQLQIKQARLEKDKVRRPVRVQKIAIKATTNFLPSTILTFSTCTCKKEPILSS